MVMRTPNTRLGLRFGATVGTDSPTHRCLAIDSMKGPFMGWPPMDARGIRSHD